MKKLFLLLLWGCCALQLHAQKSVTITPNLLSLPNLSYSEIITLPAPSNGSIVFDITNNVIRVYVNNKWRAVSLVPEDTPPDTVLPSGIIAWKAGGPAISNEWTQAPVVDAGGNVYITGYFTGTMTFGNSTITSTGTYNSYVAKYNSNGVVQWVKKINNDSQISTLDIALDAGANVYVTGVFYDKAVFDSINVTSAGNNIFVAKYNSAGTIQWVKNENVNNDTYVRSIAVDNNGNSYITGQFYNTATFGTTAVTSTGSSDIFLAKYNSGGLFQWVKKAGGNSNDQGHKIAVDGNENVYIIGIIDGLATFETISISGSYHIFLAKYDANGNIQWAEKTDWDTGLPYSEIAVDSNGNSYITHAGGIRVAKYNSNGILQWSKENLEAMGSCTGVSCDAAGNAYISGWFYDTLTLGETSVTSSGSDDMYVAKLNSSGNFQWVKKAGGAYVERTYGNTATSNGIVYVTGQFFGLATFGTTTLTPLGNWDIFVMRVVE